MISKTQVLVWLYFLIVLGPVNPTGVCVKTMIITAKGNIFFPSDMFFSSFDLIKTQYVRKY